MPAPLIPIAITAGAQGVRMAAPKVAKFLMDQGYKKASASALKKAGSNVGRVTQKDAQKLVPHSITKGGRAAPVPKSSVQKKLTAAVKAAGKETPKVKRKPRAGTKPQVKGKSPGRIEKIARVAVGQGEKGRRTGTALRNKKNIVSKVLGRKPGTVAGVSKKDQNIAKGVRVAAGTAAAAGTLAGMSGGDKSYTIKSGDTLSQIAKKYGTTLGKLLDANPKFRGKDAAGRAKANRIKPGQKISLSGIVSPRKSVYQDTTKKEMAGMQMNKKRKAVTDKSVSSPRGSQISRKGGGRVGVGAALKGYGAVR
jgi:LysM repeat protein